MSGGVQLPQGPSVLTSVPNAPRLRAVDATRGTRALAGAIGGAADALGDQLDKTLERDAQTAAWQAQDRLASEFAQWDAEARRARQGSRAKGYSQEVQDWWAKAASREAGALSPLAQRFASRGLSAAQLAAQQRAAAYEEQQLEIGAVSAFKSAQATMVQSAIEAGPVAGAVIVEQAKQEARAFAAQRGLDAEAEVLRLTSGVYTNMVQALAMQRPDLATKLFQERRGEIDAAQHAEIEKVLKAETDNFEARKFAASVARLPLAEQLSQATEKVTDPERLDKTLQAIKANHGVLEAARREQEGRAADEAWQLVGQGKRPPEALLAKMDGKERVQLQDHLRARAEQAAARATPKTDWNVYLDLRERIAAGEKVRLQAYTTKLAGAQLEQLVDLQTKAAKPAEIDSMLTDKQRVDNALVGLGIDAKKDPDSAGAFAAEVDRRVRAASGEKGGKPLTADEKQKIVDTVAMDRVYLDEWGPDPEKPVSLLKPDELEAAYVKVGGRNVRVSTVPASDRMQIIAALRAAGRPATEQAIVELYLKAQQAKAPK